MLGDEDAASILSRKHRSCVESHAECRDVRPEFQNGRPELTAGTLLPEFRISDRDPMTVGITEVLSFDGRMIKLIGRLIVAQPVPAVVGKPELLRGGVPIEADGIPDAAGDDFIPCAVRIHPGNMAVTVTVGLAH